MAIQVESLTKRFEQLTAVDSVTFSVQKGEVFGLLGPNGAGKTTIINMLTTLLAPTSGTAHVAGYSIHEKTDEIRKTIGIIFQDPSLDIGLTARENLDFHGMMYGMEKEERKTKIEAILSILELADRADDLVENFSGGMKRRLEIGRGLLHSPEILFLDEPTLGLDAQTRRKIWEYIRRLNQQYGVTLIITTHYLEEADFLCSRVAIIDKGKIIADDAPQRLKNVIGGDLITIDCGEETLAAQALLLTFNWIHAIKVEGSYLNLTLDEGERKIPLITSALSEKNIKVYSVNLQKPSLEKVFLHYIGNTIREEKGSRFSYMKENKSRRMRR